MKPLKGVRIVSVEQFGAGPYATMLLADLGAEVIKIENAAIGGDPSRRTGPFMLGQNDSEYYQAFNINKKSVAVDLRTEGGKVAVKELAASADALLNNLRGDLPAKLGLDYKSMAAVNAKLVCVHLSAYGRDNERASWPGYDYLMQAESGLMHLTGEPDGPPSRLGAPSIIDQTTGLTAAVGLLSAIIQARASGKGCDVDTCLLDVALHQLGYVATWYLNEGHVSMRQPRSAHYSVAPVQTFPTADGWLFIMCMTDKFWSELVSAVERPDLLTDPRFATQALRQANRDALTSIIDGEMRRQSNAYWLGKLNGVLPVAPVLDLAEALDNPFLKTTGMINVIAHPERPEMRVLANPIRINGQRLSQASCSVFGADNSAYVGTVQSPAAAGSS
jgi:crotonobetainyl-CoA:carnitine CoA-transferase CaiB-like acyl-CoA transferase